MDIKSSGSLNAEQIEILVQAMDAVSDAYAANNKVIFASESERAKAHFGPVIRGLKQWSKSKRCMVPGCGDRSIVRSHAVPKGMSLSLIAEKGHLVRPVFDQKIGNVRADPVGISDATTFPGFCKVHELLFEEFENKKAIDTEPHIYLQAYRAACRELFRTTFLIEQHEWMMAEYVKARDKGLLRLMDDQLRSSKLGRLDISSFTISDDPIVAEANARVEAIATLATHLKTTLVPALEHAVFRGDPAGILIDATSIDLDIPLALSGSGNFMINDNGEAKEVFLLVSVVPHAGSTLLILGAHVAQADFVLAYKRHWFKHALGILSMIESWMINGTDQWCLKPSVWNAIPAHRQLRLLSQLEAWERNIGDECDDSIFDDIRRHMILESDAVNAGNNDAGYVEYIASERKKME